MHGVMEWLGRVPLWDAALIGLAVLFLAIWLGALLERSRSDEGIVVHDQVDTWAVLQDAHFERERRMTPLPVDRKVRPLRPMPAIEREEKA